MYDAVTPSNIPSNAQMVAGYVNGRYAWKDSDWTRFPNAIHVTIAGHPDNTTSEVLDYENGDFSDSDVVSGVTVRRSNGVDPTVYCSEGIWAHVRDLFTNAGVAQPHYWVAAYPGAGASIPAGAVAHQYTDAGPYDISVVVDFWPGVDTGGITMPNLQDNDPNFLQLCARIGAMFSDLQTAGQALTGAPLPNETNQLMVEVQSLTAAVAALTTKVNALQAGNSPIVFAPTGQITLTPEVPAS